MLIYLIIIYSMFIFLLSIQFITYLLIIRESIIIFLNTKKNTLRNSTVLQGFYKFAMRKKPHYVKFFMLHIKKWQLLFKHIFTLKPKGCTISSMNSLFKSAFEITTFAFDTIKKTSKYLTFENSKLEFFKFLMVSYWFEVTGLVRCWLMVAYPMRAQIRWHWHLNLTSGR